MAKEYIEVSWKKGKGIDGYQIAYSTSKNMDDQISSTAKAGSTSLKLKNLEKFQNYYIRIRTFKKVDSKKIYSKWSAKKKIKYNGK